MTPQASAFATPAHRPLSLPKKKNGRPPRLRGVGMRVVSRARGGSCSACPQRRGYSIAASGVRRTGPAAHLVAEAMTDVATSTCHAVTGGNSAPSWSAEERETRVALSGESGPRCEALGAAGRGAARAASAAHAAQQAAHARRARRSQREHAPPWLLSQPPGSHPRGAQGRRHSQQRFAASTGYVSVRKANTIRRGARALEIAHSTARTRERSGRGTERAAAASQSHSTLRTPH